MCWSLIEMCEVNKIEPRVHNNWGRSGSLAFCMCSCDPSAVISHFQREACLAYFIMVLICTGGLFLQKREKTQAQTIPGFIARCSCAGRHPEGLSERSISVSSSHFMAPCFFQSLSLSSGMLRKGFLCSSGS